MPKRTVLTHAKAQLARRNDAGADVRLAHRSDLLVDSAGWVAHQIRDDVRVEQMSVGHV